MSRYGLMRTTGIRTAAAGHGQLCWFKSCHRAYKLTLCLSSSANNNNPRRPAKKIHPKKSPGDAPYKQSEKQLRQQIFIPSTFTYGKKPPVILVPGTGARGFNNFMGNLIPLLQGKPYADIVWINPVGFQLADAQSNAENVAYAINYISGISGNKNVSIVGWSQGSESMQWALHYFPSTRGIVTDQVAVSAVCYLCNYRFGRANDLFCRITTVPAWRTSLIQTGMCRYHLP